MKHRLPFIPTVLVAALIAYLSLLREPHFHLPDLNISFIDKWGHLVMYLAFAAVLTIDLWRAEFRATIVATLALLIPIVYGGIIEILQERYFYPRTGEWLDWAADALGALLGMGITVLVVYRKTIFKR